MQELDAHVGGRRPFGLNYWPLAQDDPGVEIPRESIRLVSPDGALVVHITNRNMDLRPVVAAAASAHGLTGGVRGLAQQGGEVVIGQDGGAALFGRVQQDGHGVSSGGSGGQKA